MNGFDKIITKTEKTVNGYPVGDWCVTCGTVLERGRWLCSNCSVSIGSSNINSTVASIPKYLHNSQCEQWLKLKLLKYIK